MHCGEMFILTTPLHHTAASVPSSAHVPCSHLNLHRQLPAHDPNNRSQKHQAHHASSTIHLNSSDIYTTSILQGTKKKKNRSWSYKQNRATQCNACFLYQTCNCHAFGEKSDFSQCPFPSIQHFPFQNPPLLPPPQEDHSTPDRHPFPVRLSLYVPIQSGSISTYPNKVVSLTRAALVNYCPR